MRCLMGDSPSFLHRWKKTLFPWGQPMCSSLLISSFEGWWWWGVFIPLSLLFLPSLISLLGGRRAGWQVLSHQTPGSSGVPRRNWEAAHGGYLIWASAGQGIYIYIAAGWSFSPLWFFTLLFPNTADETRSLFRIRESIWLPESLFPSEYGTVQGKLFGGWCWDYWPEHDT